MRIPKPVCKRGYWYIRIHGRDYYLGKYKDEAFATANVLIMEKLHKPKNDRNSLTIGDALNLFLDDLSSVISKGTLYNYSTACATLRGIVGKCRVSDFTKYEFSNLLNRLLASGKTFGTIKCYRRLLLASLKYAEQRSLAPDGIFHSLDVIPVPRRARRPARVTPINIQDIEAVKDLLGDTIYDILRLEYLTGMRPCELLSLRKQDFIKTGSGLWKVIIENHKSAWKTGRPLVKFIGPRAQEVLEKYLHNEGPLFRSSRGLPLYPNLVTSKIYYLRKRYPERFPEQFTQYQCRHRAGTDSRREAGLEGAQAYLGHACRATSEIYAEVDYSLAETIARKIG